MKNYPKNLVLLAFVTAMTFSGYAQPGNPSGEPDVPPAPIDDYIPHFILLAVVIAGCYFYKKSIKKTQNI